MMSSYNFVLVCDYPIDKSASEIDALKEFLNDVPDTTVLVFWYDVNNILSNLSAVHI